ncbi:hypothetical protein T265_16225, partial [Opisthorchis viverrini]
MGERLPRGRNFVVTINNPTETPDELVRLFLANNIQYAFQRERGREEGTEHYQMCLHFQDAKTCRQVITLLPGCHVEFARNPIAARRYRVKADTGIEGPWTNDEEKTEGAKKENTMHEIVEKYESGTRIHQLAEEYPNLFARNFNNICRTLDLVCHYTPRSTKTEILWFYGKTGTGKSSKALQMVES